MINRMIFAAAIACLSFSSARAELAKVDWPSQLGGLDGVTIACANANSEKYAAAICDDMLASLTQKLEKGGLKFANLGAYQVKEVERPDAPADMGKPLDLTVNVRGTNSGNVYAIALGIVVSVAYNNAVEKGSDGAGRKGDLVIWETSTTGSGPRSGLSKAIVKLTLEKAEADMAAIIEAFPK